MWLGKDGKYAERIFSRPAYIAALAAREGILVRLDANGALRRQIDRVVLIHRIVVITGNPKILLIRNSGWFLLILRANKTAKRQ